MNRRWLTRRKMRISSQRHQRQRKRFTIKMMLRSKPVLRLTMLKQMTKLVKLAR